MSQEAATLPIDIHVQKLMDWLISRRHIKDGWQNEITKIRGKITAALNDMPAHEKIAELLSGSYINYFHCRQIVDILRETEKDTKNIFGFYSSQRMKDWQEIVKLYEADNVYLAEAAQLLFRNVQYEIPGLKRQIAKYDTEQQECDKREAEYLKNAEGMRAKYRQSCKQMNVEGADLKRELIAQLDELPREFEAIARGVRDAGRVCEFYEAVVRFCLGRDRPAVECVPVVKFLAERGNVTTYEWQYGEPPLKVEPAPVVEWDLEEAGGGEKRKDSSSSGDFEKIDFGETEGNGNGNGDFIDIGDSAEGEIDWGSGEAAEGNGVIDWGPGGQDALEVSLEDAGITLESSGTEGGVAKEEQALSLLDNPKTRGLIVDDLSELEAFLERRLAEMSGTDGGGDESVLAMSIFQDAPGGVQMQNAAEVGRMLTEVRTLLEMLTNVRIQHLFLIKSSPRYVDRLVQNVKQKLDIAEKLENNAQQMREKKAEAAKMQGKMTPELKRMIEKTKILQQQIEEEISKKYKNRPVHLMAAGLS